MRRIRFVLVVLFAGLVVTGYLMLRALGFFGNPSLARPRPVPRGHQEIAYIQAATNGASWERFVAGIRRLRQEWPEIEVVDENAFPEQTAKVPEIALGFKGCDAKLWFRWYKITSEVGIKQWVQELARREPAPLAITGAGSSDRARDLSEALAAQMEWQGTPPLHLLTTATADEIYLQDDHAPQPIAQPLMALYPGRSFRFCFANHQMAEAVRDFLWTHPNLWSVDSVAPSLSGVPMALSGDLLGSLAPLTLGSRLQLPDVRILEWADDPYSTDLSKQFRGVLNQPGYEANSVACYTLKYSVGGYYRPNPSEAGGIKILVDQMTYAPDQRHLLVLPAMEKPARRILRGLTATAPGEIRDMVAVTGDSISFNVIYRDRDIAWNIQDMPVPLVFFTHQNPVAWKEGPAHSPARAESGTDDELLNAEIVRVLLEATFAGCARRRATGEPKGPARLVANSDDLARELRGTLLPDAETPYFRDDGNRQGGSGEYVICLRPKIDRGRVLPEATIEVWRRQANNGHAPRWVLVREPLRVKYADSPHQGGTHADF
ncbi:MAG: hypothetical protein K2R98_25535 [Gemmataceae bacterium]|nr:hypothetical protein [Gemmataceae bacterium]